MRALSISSVVDLLHLSLSTTDRKEQKQDFEKSIQAHPCVLTPQCVRLSVSSKSRWRHSMIDGFTVRGARAASARSLLVCKTARTRVM